MSGLEQARYRIRAHGEVAEGKLRSSLVDSKPPTTVLAQAGRVKQVPP